MSKMRLGVIFGGKSTEHEVSRVSAAHVIEAADPDKYDIVKIGITPQGRWLLYEGPTDAMRDGSWQAKAEADLASDPERFGFSVVGSAGRQLKDMIDFALPILHGVNGEDGSVQGLLQIADIPYGGSGIAGSAVAMDKITAKRVMDAVGIPQTPYIAFLSSEVSPELEARINAELRYPVFIKPVNMGSSVGISKVKTPAELMPAIEFAARFDSRLLAEQGVDCREIEVAVMGNDEPKAFALGEIIVGAEFYDYDDKYTNGVSHPEIPAKIEPELRDRILRLAEEAYKAMGCEGFSRCDFMVDRGTGEVFINEINTIPGFTPISMFPMLMQSAGVSYSEIIDRIVELGLERFRRRTALQSARM